jgi:hypothetical protein
LLFLLLLRLLGGFWLSLLLCHSDYSLFQLAYNDGYYDVLSRFWLMMLQHFVLLCVGFVRHADTVVSLHTKYWYVLARDPCEVQICASTDRTDSDEILPTRHLYSMVRTT